MIQPIAKITNLNFNTPEAFERSLALWPLETIEAIRLAPSSYGSSTMMTFRKKFLKFREIIVRYNLKCRDANLQKELDEYKLKACLLGLGT